jgi:peptidoglycan/xylan/chitin deacetylase (PgdA/CDA1 family)
MVYLMYHEVELPGRDLCRTEPGYVRYVVREAEFQKQVAFLRTQGFSGMSVGQALDLGLGGAMPIVLTFDDGCETDFITAAPLLREARFSATFYVVVDNVDRAGYLSRCQLRQLIGLNFEIGCHSMTHPYLTDLDPRQLRAEIVDSKDALAQLVGRCVDHFSCPGGRWNQDVARVAREAGYRSVVTSRIGTNSATTDPFRLARLAVRRGTSLRDFEQLCRGKGQLMERARDQILSLAKSVLGNPAYERLRSLLLGPS